MGTGLSEWAQRKAKMEDRIRESVLAELASGRIGRSKDYTPPPRVVSDAEVASRMVHICKMAEDARKSLVSGDATTTGTLLYEIALQADYRMVPAQRKRTVEDLSEDRSPCTRGGGIP